MPASEFAKRMDALVDEIHAAPRAEGIERLYVPGEMEWERYARAEKHGIPIPDDVLVNPQQSR
jgi:LDH2 family malate/lactate/ureidoglycolate dehydrogenase